jgi:hypothetical protein
MDIIFTFLAKDNASVQIHSYMHESRLKEYQKNDSFLSNASEYECLSNTPQTRNSNMHAIDPYYHYKSYN